MAQKKQPFDLELTLDAADGANDLRMDRVPVGFLFCIQHVTVENETTAYTNLRLIKARPGREFPLEEQDSPEAATLYWMADDFYLVPGQYLLARLTGCTAGDKLRVYITGWLQDVGGGDG